MEPSNLRCLLGLSLTILYLKSKVIGRTEKILHFIKHFEKSHFPENYGIFDKMEKSNFGLK